MMQDKRRHKRFKLDLMEINSKMLLADRVDILDISFGGISLKSDRRLNINRKYLVKLGDKESSVDVEGLVIRSELSGIEERVNGERVSMYTAGMIFEEGSTDKIADFFRKCN